MVLLSNSSHDGSTDGDSYPPFTNQCKTKKSVAIIHATGDKCLESGSAEFGSVMRRKVTFTRSVSSKLIITHAGALIMTNIKNIRLPILSLTPLAKSSVIIQYSKYCALQRYLDTLIQIIPGWIFIVICFT